MSDYIENGNDSLASLRHPSREWISGTAQVSQNEDALPFSMRSPGKTVTGIAKLFSPDNMIDARVFGSRWLRHDASPIIADDPKLTRTKFTPEVLSTIFEVDNSIG